MLNEQIARILQSKPENLMLAVQHNNQELFNLETLLEQRGKQVASLQAILSSEVGLVDKVINTKGHLSRFQVTIQGMAAQLDSLKEHVKATIKKSYSQLISEIAKVFKELCMDKEQREEQIKSLKEQVARLNEQITLRSQEILHLDRQSSLEQQIRECRIPMLDTKGYTLGNQSLKELFAPVNQQLLTLSKLKDLKEQSYQGNLYKSQKQGKGEVLYQKGYSYKGLFKNGQKHGFGELIYQDQVVYRGEWKRDLFWGKGSLYLKVFETQFENGTIYMGNFQNGQFHGLGVVQFDDGTRLTSEFSHGKESSAGILKKNYTSNDCQVVQNVNDAYKQPPFDKLSPLVIFNPNMKTQYRVLGAQLSLLQFAQLI